MFMVSAAALAAVSWHIAVRLATGAADRAWIALAMAAMLLGATSMVASVPGLYTPIGFLATQGILSGASIWLARLVSRRFVASDEKAAACPARGGRVSPARPRFTALEWAALFAIATLLALSLIERSLVPIYQFDDLVYHGSRAGYWIQHRSVLPYPTHEPRQVAFPFGAELLFAWPLLFTGQDLPARLIFWTALPLTAIGIYSLARALEAPRAAALLAALLYVAAPRVAFLGSTIKPDIWAPLFAVGSVYWLVRARRGDTAGAPLAACFWAGVLGSLAMSVKITTGAIIPVLAVAPFLMADRRTAVRAVAATAAGGLLAAVATGLAFLLLHNTVVYEHPLGPRYLRDIVRAEPSLRQIWTHLVRLPLFLLELPEIPAPGARDWLASAADSVVAWLGADQPLPGEQPGQAPGPAPSPVSARGWRLGIGGAAWLVALVVGLPLCAWELLRAPTRRRVSALGIVILAQAVMLFSVIILIRWMPHNSVRFWLPAYAVGLAAVVAIPMRWSGARPVLTAIAICAGAIAAYPAAMHATIRIDHHRTRDFRPPEMHWFGPALEQIPDGSTIIFLGQGSAHDYQLLAPHGRLVNRVVPWGSGPPDPARLDQLIDRHEPDFILTWRLPPRHAPALEAWLAGRQGAREIPLQIPSPTRLFDLRRPPQP